MRQQYREFVERHEVAWELAMAALALFYVIIGFASDDAPLAIQPTLAALETTLTAVFLAEFATRFVAAEPRHRYLQTHGIDLVALLPLARGLRVARLVRLLRLVRTFTGLRRAFIGIDRLSNHHGFGSLFIAWLGTMFVCSTAFYAVESGVNPHVRGPSDALWWGITTLTGGYIDIQPVTDEGRIAAALLLLVGVALFTAMTAVLVSYFVAANRHAHEPALHPHDQLRALKALLDEEVISQADFDTKKAQVLDRSW